MLASNNNVVAGQAAGNLRSQCLIPLRWCILRRMEKKNPAAVELGRAGGLARKKALSAAQRKQIAKKASKAAAEARTKKARQKRKSAKKGSKRTK